MELCGSRSIMFDSDGHLLHRPFSTIPTPWRIGCGIACQCRPTGSRRTEQAVAFGEHRAKWVFFPSPPWPHCNTFYPRNSDCTGWLILHGHKMVPWTTQRAIERFIRHDGVKYGGSRQLDPSQAIQLRVIQRLYAAARARRPAAIRHA